MLRSLSFSLSLRSRSTAVVGRSSSRRSTNSISSLHRGLSTAAQAKESHNTNSQPPQNARHGNNKNKNKNRPPRERNPYYGQVDEKGSFYATGRGKAIHQYGAPTSICAIAEGLQDVGNRQAAIRELGCCRRVFLLDSYLSEETCEGLAYRLDKLKHNPAMNSVLIATDGTDDADAMPRIMNDLDPAYTYDDHLTAPPGTTNHVAGGYDPLLIQDHAHAERTLAQWMQLSKAVQGADVHKCKIPIIFLPHGAVTDGGAAFFLSSYVLATPETSYQILNPRRGLSLDPTGMSWWLPRVGQEFAQEDAQQYAAGCALIIALTGYQATAEDLVDVGLATHYVPNAHTIVPYLEDRLLNTRPWNQQALLQEPKKYQGDFQQTRDRFGIFSPHYDHNADYRNVQVANIIDDVAEYSADGVHLMENEFEDLTWDIMDPSLDIGDEPPLMDVEFRQSHLLTLARTFHDIFFHAGSVQEIHALLTEVANNATSTQVTPAKAQAAAEMVARMDLASPLALTCTYQLLKKGNARHETLEGCMARECRVQQKFLTDERASRDFQTWKEAQKKAGGSNEVVTGLKWQDESLKHVSWDQMVEIVEG